MRDLRSVTGTGEARRDEGNDRIEFHRCLTKEEYE
jgi:hypothetical protein